MPPVAAPAAVERPVAAPYAPPLDSAAQPATLAPPVVSSPAVTASAAPSPDIVRKAIAEALRSAQCTAATGDTASGVIMVRGVAGYGAGEAALHAAMQDAASGDAIDWQVAAAKGPYCGALDVIRSYARPFAASSRAVGVALANGKTMLLANDLVIPRVTMPDFPAHLQLDYIASDGSVLHMRDATSAAPYPASASLMFGEPKPGFKGWAVDEPFGTDLIIAIASSAPLFPAGRPANDTLDGYVRDLQTALDQASRAGARVSATAFVLRTSAKPPR